MFLAQFTDDEKLAFLGLARRMIAADGVVASEELELLAALGEEMALATLNEPPSELTALYAAFHTPQTKAMVLMELASIAFIDNYYAPSEAELLSTLAETWGIGRVLVKQVENWAGRRVDVARTAAMLIADFADEQHLVLDQ